MLVDVNVSFGGREGIQRFRLETALEQLNRTPWSLAFVHCRQGMIDQTAANDQALAVCRDHQHLLPAATIDPRDTFVWRGEVDRCLAAGVRLYRIYPVEGNWPADSIFLYELVARLSGTGAVLLVDATMPGLPTRIAEVTAGAHVPVIFVEARYFPLAELLLLMQRYPHVYVETSRITSPEGIELSVATVGAERLLFGSGAARYPAWVAWQVLQRAEIGEAEREAIAWRNAAALFGLSPKSVTRAVPPAADWDASGMPIVDVHLHDKISGAPLRPFSVATYVAEMERVGIRQGVCSSVTAISYDLKQGNDEMADLLDRVPSLHGYVVVDPRYHDESVHELRRLDDNQRFVGVKIHPQQAKTATAHPLVRRLFAEVARYGKPVLIHNEGTDWPDAIVALAREHPELPIIAAHAGYGDAPHPTHDAAWRLAAAPNIWLEFCSTYLAVGAIRRGIEAVGAERMLFGSDYPLISLAYMRAAYEDAGLSNEEAELILYRNAWRLYPTIAGS